MKQDFPQLNESTRSNIELSTWACLIIMTKVSKLFHTICLQSQPTFSCVEQHQWNLFIPRLTFLSKLCPFHPMSYWISYARQFIKVSSVGQGTDLIDSVISWLISLSVFSPSDLPLAPLGLSVPLNRQEFWASFRPLLIGLKTSYTRSLIECLFGAQRWHSPLTALSKTTTVLC